MISAFEEKRKRAPATDVILWLLYVGRCIYNGEALMYLAGRIPTVAGVKVEDDSPHFPTSC